MHIQDCGGCGNCMDWIKEGMCPTGAFNLSDGEGYGSAVIDKEKCIDCGRCKEDIECLCEAIEED